MHTDVIHQNSLGNQNLTNDSNSFPTPDATQSVQPVKKMRGPRLNARGIAVLEEYLSLHPDDTQPATMTQKSLLAQVQSAQGNSDLKLPSIYYWFRRRRVKLEEQSRQPPPQSSNQGRLITTPLTPTSPTTPFTEETLIKLHTLAQATPNPGPEVLDIWASLFHVSRPVLQYAIEVVLPSHFRTTPQTSPNSRHTEPSPRSPTSPTYAPSPRSRRLPTPPRSSTPELLPRDRWSRGRTPNFSKNETHSPLIPNMNIMGGPPAFHQYDRPSIVVPSAPLLAPASLPPVVHEQPLLHLSPPQTPVAKDNSNTLVAGPGPPAVVLSSSDMTALRISAVKNSVRRGLTEACLEATVQNNNTQEPLPKTAGESNQRFAPYNATLENLSIFLDVMLKQPSPPPSHE